MLKSLLKKVLFVFLSVVSGGHFFFKVSLWWCVIPVSEMPASSST